MPNFDVVKYKVSFGSTPCSFFTLISELRKFLWSLNTPCLFISVMFNLQKEAGDAEGMGAIGPDGEVSKLLWKGKQSRCE